MNQIEFVNIVKLLTSFTGVKWCLPAACLLPACCLPAAVNAANILQQMLQEMCCECKKTFVRVSSRSRCVFGILTCSKCCKNYAANAAEILL